MLQQAAGLLDFCHQLYVVDLWGHTIWDTHHADTQRGDRRSWRHGDLGARLGNSARAHHGVPGTDL